MQYSSQDRGRSGGIKRGTFNVIQWHTTAEKVYYMLETMLEIHS